MPDAKAPAASARAGGMSPRAFALDFITRWEDGGSTDPNRTHSLDPDDRGNWTGGKPGLGRLVGSNHGVTAPVLALHRHVPVATITTSVMRALTVAEAADIGVDLFYADTHLNVLPWNRVTMSVLDMCWGAGPANGIRLLQRLVGAAPDGGVSPGGETARLYPAWLARRGEALAASDYAVSRNAYYEAVIAAKPTQAKYRNGWCARTAYYLPGDKTGWWARAA